MVPLTCRLASSILWKINLWTLGSSCWCLLAPLQPTAIIWGCTQTSTGSKSADRGVSAHGLSSAWQNQYRNLAMLSLQTTSTPHLCWPSTCQAMWPTCAAPCTSTASATLATWSRQRPTSIAFPMVQQSGDSVMTWWLHRGKTTEWCTFFPLCTCRLTTCAPPSKVARKMTLLSSFPALPQWPLTQTTRMWS